ncbi:MAG TPA: sodium-extruding oxaloacetate decarboxylase subunit alpha [bacterium]
MAKTNKEIKKKVLITETVFRDAHQSLLATRMRTEDMLPICEKIDRVGYWSAEVWGGATFDSCMRYLREDPWERLKQIRKALPNTKLQMLLRGQNLVGYKHYPDDVVEKFVEKAIENGIDIIRIFDALNDIRNIKTSANITKKMGAHLQTAISYTVSPVHSINYFVELAEKMEDLGCDSICIKDMAGLLTPFVTYKLVKNIKEKIKVPLHLHSHDTGGFASMNALKAIEAGVDMIDTAISPLSSGTSHPPTESIVAALKDTEYNPDLNLELLGEIADYFRTVVKKYSRFRSEFTSIDTSVLVWQIPGGMLSNLANQLKEQDSLHLIKEVLAEVPRVRKDFGYPPLVTPTSQIVGAQATLNVLTGERYKVITTESKNYLCGLYGKPPGQVNQSLLKKIIKEKEIIKCRAADLLEPEMEKLTKELRSKAKNVEDILSYALFPNIALEFFELREQGKLKPVEELEKPLEKVHLQPKISPSEFIIKLHGDTYHIKVAGVGPKGEGPRPFFIKVNNHLEEVLVESLMEEVRSLDGNLLPPVTTAGIRPKAVNAGDITTPIPGKVRRIKVKEGQHVNAGDTIMILEAMKMENEVHTPTDGIVKKLYVREGDDVNPQETLAMVEEQEKTN